MSEAHYVLLSHSSSHLDVTLPFAQHEHVSIIYDKHFTGVTLITSWTPKLI